VLTVNVLGTAAVLREAASNARPRAFVADTAPGSAPIRTTKA